MVVMNEYQVAKFLQKTLSMKFIFVKKTKSSILVLLNKNEKDFLKTAKMLTSEEESGILSLDLADFTRIQDMKTVTRFFNNNKNSIYR